ncbi:hypothetical protein EF912_35780 [Streptomyces sp. WAC07061]|uniref:hypothetical protein n=1 Tax=Streptomyces sp. WAC07061 TaxID=2487410 RepID=UPI000F786F48|nr:hypothetical protein [Streptomyces sp. WAC07061]RSS36027.1 hypothetical protein EF912_35780 [Streptomyces sp. WAC07061]
MPVEEYGTSRLRTRVVTAPDGRYLWHRTHLTGTPPDRTAHLLTPSPNVAAATFDWDTETETETASVSPSKVAAATWGGGVCTWAGRAGGVPGSGVGCQSYWRWGGVTRRERCRRCL